ncbi:hypothetical protein SAMN05216388_102613 [Halorientalis persicus]|uniref:Uncharacterized protein n=1 Tax=Halorientalis persicus TaxID=1367881 RepID=A0A1H8U7U8_9EURY|nr:hypothetical protein SAMN05216388_102613 [Halorientalis persicus]
MESARQYPNRSSRRERGHTGCIPYLPEPTVRLSAKMWLRRLSRTVLPMSPAAICGWIVARLWTVSGYGSCSKSSEAIWGQNVSAPAVVMAVMRPANQIVWLNPRWETIGIRWSQSGSDATATAVTERRIVAATPAVKYPRRSAGNVQMSAMPRWPARYMSVVYHPLEYQTTVWFLLDALEINRNFLDCFDQFVAYPCSLVFQSRRCCSLLLWRIRLRIR